MYLLCPLLLPRGAQEVKIDEVNDGNPLSARRIHWEFVYNQALPILLTSQSCLTLERKMPSLSSDYSW